MALTDYACRQAKPREKSYKLYDAKHLYLEVTPQGRKHWRLRYWIAGRETRQSLGLYPHVSLKSAREKRDEIQRAIANGTFKKNFPRRESASAKNTFESVAREWLGKQAKILSPKTVATALTRLEHYVFPRLASADIADIESPAILAILTDLDAAGTLETAARVRQIMGQVFRYALATGRAKTDPTWALRGAITPARPRHFPSIIIPREVGQLMADIDNCTGYVVVRLALRLAPLVFVRPGELRHAEWVDIDLARAEWRIPAEKMKMRSAHIVPLSTQAVEILETLQPITGLGRYLFPSIRTLARPISENTINVALRRLGYRHDQIVGHGFRSMASTLLNEMGVRPDLIERQLAHVERNQVRAAYNRAEYLAERREMMQRWADHLDDLKSAANATR